MNKSKGQNKQTDEVFKQNFVDKTATAISTHNIIPPGRSFTKEDKDKWIEKIKEDRDVKEVSLSYDNMNVELAAETTGPAMVTAPDNTDEIVNKAVETVGKKLALNMDDNKTIIKKRNNK